MVTISFKTAEILDIVVAIGSLEKGIASNYAYSMHKVLNKFKKVVSARADKAYINTFIESFDSKHLIKLATYKKK